MATVGGDSNEGDNSGNFKGGGTPGQSGGSDGGVSTNWGGFGSLPGGWDGGNDSNPGFAAAQLTPEEQAAADLAAYKKSPQGQAAAAIQKGLDAATATTEAGVETGRSDLQPFTDAGLGSLGSIQNLLTPEGQNDFINKNPFFDALKDDAQRRLFNNTSARGKIGSGGTAAALQNSFALLGNDLVGQEIDRNMGVLGIGANAATNQASISGAGALNLAELEARGGETQAAGILGLENTRRQDKSNKRSDSLGFLGSVIGGALKFSDRRYKTDITALGHAGDVPVYLFKYKGSDKLEVGTMAQEVEHIAGAVINIGDKKYVDYSRII
jgi:hypothetical protein